jgi:hypothetical protein
MKHNWRMFDLPTIYFSAHLKPPSTTESVLISRGRKGYCNEVQGNGRRDMFILGVEINNVSATSSPYSGDLTSGHIYDSSHCKLFLCSRKPHMYVVSQNSSPLMKVVLISVISASGSGILTPRGNARVLVFNVPNLRTNQPFNETTSPLRLGAKM